MCEHHPGDDRSTSCQHTGAEAFIEEYRAEQHGEHRNQIDEGSGARAADMANGLGIPGA